MQAPHCTCCAPDVLEDSPLEPSEESQSNDLGHPVHRATAMGSAHVQEGTRSRDTDLARRPSLVRRNKPRRANTAFDQLDMEGCGAVLHQFLWKDGGCAGGAACLPPERAVSQGYTGLLIKSSVHAVRLKPPRIIRQFHNSSKDRGGRSI